MDGHTKKTVYSINTFVRYSHFYSPAIDWKILQSDWPRVWAISDVPIFPNMKFVQAYNNYSIINFHYRPNWEKNKELRKKKTFLYIQRILGLAYFPHFWGKTLFSKNLAVMHNTTWTPNIMLSSRKTKEPIPRQIPNRRTNRPYHMTLLALARGPVRK